MSAGARTRTLVTGYTGRLGGMVTAILQTRYGVQPRVLIRPQHLDAPDWQAPSNVEVATGDYEDTTSLETALTNIDTVFLVSPVHPNMRARELALASAAAQQTNPPHIVKISGLGTQIGSFVDSGRWHAEIEQGIHDLGLSLTCLRPLFLMQNLGQQMTLIRKTGVVRSAVGNAAIAMVDARDVAEVAAAAMVNDTAIRGQDVTITGPKAYTYEDVANVCSDVLGRPVAYQRQSKDDVRATLKKLGQPEWHIDILIQFNEAFVRGWASKTSDVVERVLGRPPRSLAAYLVDP